MQVPELALALYDAFAPSEAKEKARVRSEIMTEWNGLVIDETSPNYAPNKEGTDFWTKIKVLIKKNMNGGWTSMFTGLLYPVFFKAVTNWMNPSDDGEEQITSLRA